MFGIGLPEIFIISIILLILIVPVWLMGKILVKAGFSAWYSLISFVPSRMKLSVDIGLNLVL